MSKNVTKATLERMMRDLLEQAEEEGIYDKVCFDGQKLINDARKMVGMEKLPDHVGESEICIRVYPKRFSVQGDPCDRTNYEVSVKVQGVNIGIESIDVDWN